MPRIYYSPESVVIPGDFAAILEWAACHIEQVGLHQGARLYAGPGRTATLPRWPRGAINVAAGEGRQSARHSYDWSTIHRARDEAYRAFAEHLTARPLDADTPENARRLHRDVMDQWSADPGRTAEHAAQGLRAAAGHADHSLF
ncbi:DUF6197 family protein [Streptomyces jumonjinensis]|uniref:Uncharacterized protein n=1 Tax=Streptomyces jumonjinensis TaxID=1945 RepID=A0A646KSN1_STRJU|nr:DUF6197 family protein [Streptomyces jumonjinensis]MQT05098.1 hypothetical protein [Streptomyces jumonjinensis]